MPDKSRLVQSEPPRASTGTRSITPSLTTAARPAACHAPAAGYGPQTGASVLGGIRFKSALPLIHRTARRAGAMVHAQRYPRAHAGGLERNYSSILRTAPRSARL